MLTQKERELLHLLGEGKLNKEIAEAMDISIHTVKNHLKNIYKKLSVRNRAEAIIRMHKKP
jgi:LuxR family transcriptional regulator, maltose regulon positive regulatory protein